MLLKFAYPLQSHKAVYSFSGIKWIYSSIIYSLWILKKNWVQLQNNEEEMFYIL